MSPSLESNRSSTTFIQNTPRKLCFPFFLLPIFPFNQFLWSSFTPEKDFSSYIHTWLCKPFNYQNVLGRKTLLPRFSAKLVSEGRMWSYGPGVRERFGEKTTHSSSQCFDHLVVQPCYQHSSSYNTSVQTFWHTGNMTSRNRDIMDFTRIQT